MVKNIQGGSKTKGQARKLSNSYTSHSQLRVSKSSDEIYACVTKLLGGNKFESMTVNDVKLLCRIPGKFSGNMKRSNIIHIGSIIWVGIPEYAGPYELLDIYDDEHHNQLRSIPSTKIHLLDKYINIGGCGSDKVCSDFMFSDVTNNILLPNEQIIESDTMTDDI